MLNKTQSLAAGMNVYTGPTFKPVWWIFSFRYEVTAPDLGQRGALNNLFTPGSDTDLSHWIYTCIYVSCMRAQTFSPRPWTHEFTQVITQRELLVSELTCHPFNMLSLNGSFSFWLDDIMALHTLNYRHTLLLLLQPTEGKRERD